MRKESARLMGVVFSSFLGLAFITIISCSEGGGDGGDAVPPTIDVTGTWRGTVTETAFGTSTATLSAIQSGTSVLVHTPAEMAQGVFQVLLVAMLRALQ